VNARTATASPWTLEYMTVGVLASFSKQPFTYFFAISWLLSLLRPNIKGHVCSGVFLFLLVGATVIVLTKTDPLLFLVELLGSKSSCHSKTSNTTTFSTTGFPFKAILRRTSNAICLNSSALGVSVIHE
jgi:hypothetical protein